MTTRRTMSFTAIAFAAAFSSVPLPVWSKDGEIMDTTDYCDSSLSLYVSNCKLAGLERFQKQCVMHNMSDAGYRYWVEYYFSRSKRKFFCRAILYTRERAEVYREPSNIGHAERRLDAGTKVLFRTERNGWTYVIYSIDGSSGYVKSDLLMETRPAK